MKGFMKVFFIALILLGLAAAVALYSFNMIYDPLADRSDPSIPKEDGVFNNNGGEDNIVVEDNLTPLQKAYSDENIVNVIILGMEGQRSDTVFVANFNRNTREVNFISIPRDTYYYQEGFERAVDRKFNSVFGRQGVVGAINASEEILGGMPIHNYIRLDYRAVEEIVDVLGGIQVNVPFHMEYKDTTKGSELFVDIPEGNQLLDGKTAIGYLRYRHGNEDENGNITSGYPDGDLGRIKAQQDFVNRVIKKSLSLKLPQVVEKAFKYLKTDITLTEMLSYGVDATSIEMDNVNFYTLPGKAETKSFDISLSYYEKNDAQIQDLIKRIYHIEE